ncbi:hypothetical protein BAE44_0012056, partial [Dichanthelium oligosanthes]
LFLAIALMLAASKQAEARPPTPAPTPTYTPTTPAPTPAPVPAPSQALCPPGFGNILEYLEAVPQYAARGSLLSLNLFLPAVTNLASSSRNTRAFAMLTPSSA